MPRSKSNQAPGWNIPEGGDGYDYWSVILGTGGTLDKTGPVVNQGTTKIPNTILTNSEIPAQAKIMYAILRMCSAGTYRAEVPLVTLAKLSGFSVKSASKYLTWLDHHGFIEIEGKEQPSQNPRRYTLKVTGAGLGW